MEIGVNILNKKKIYLLLGILLITLIVISGCGSSDPGGETNAASNNIPALDPIMEHPLRVELFPEMVVYRSQGEVDINGFTPAGAMILPLIARMAGDGLLFTSFFSSERWDEEIDTRYRSTDSPEKIIEKYSGKAYDLINYKTRIDEYEVTKDEEYIYFYQNGNFFYVERIVLEEGEWKLSKRRRLDQRPQSVVKDIEGQPVKKIMYREESDELLKIPLY